MEHPASEETISKVVTESQVNKKGKKEELVNSNLSGTVLFADQIKEVSEDLSQIQRIFEENLRTVLSTIYTGYADVRVVWESPDCYVIVDQDGIISEGLEAETQIPITDEILKIHSITASKTLSTYPDIDIDAGQAWVISKPTNWSRCEWTIDTYFTTLITIGLSPTQALDYWMVKQREKHLPYWADLRGTSAQAIRENVKKAENKINSYDSSETYSTGEYFERIYKGKRIDESTTEVTVDGGYLPPRRDIYCHTKSGKYTWGYSGAGPTQLAFAILSDALDETEIPHNKVTNFRDHLNNKIADSDEWEFSEQQVLEWNKNFKSIDGNDSES